MPNQKVDICYEQKYRFHFKNERFRQKLDICHQMVESCYEKKNLKQKKRICNEHINVFLLRMTLSTKKLTFSIKWLTFAVENERFPFKHNILRSKVDVFYQMVYICFEKINVFLLIMSFSRNKLTFSINWLIVAMKQPEFLL